MAAGIPDPGARRHTLTVYTDLAEFATALELESLDSVHVLLLDAFGEVVHHTDDEPTSETVGKLTAAVTRMIAAGSRAMRYLVDGYNVTMNDPATRGLGAGEQRDALVARLAVRAQALLGAGRITVAFDGRPDGAGATGSGIDVRFSGDESADDVIVRLAAAERGSVTVVTSDRELSDRVRAESSAVVLGAEALFDTVRPARRTRGRYPAASAGLPKGANKVTEELKKLWLQDGE